MISKMIMKAPAHYEMGSARDLSLSRESYRPRPSEMETNPFDCPATRLIYLLPTTYLLYPHFPLLVNATSGRGGI